MHLLSITWLFWIWITVSLYWIVPRSGRVELLATITGIFLLVHAPVSGLVLVVCTLITWSVARRAAVTTPVAIAGIGVLVMILITFKLGQSFDHLRLLETVVIPLGLSYYTFRCIHLILERLKGHVEVVCFRDVVGYLFFLPTIVIGPIHRFGDYRRDLIRQRFDPDLLSEGVERIIYGYAKIAILSNYLVGAVFGRYIDRIGDDAMPLSLYLTTVQEGVNLYLQFSGLSDVAIGFARLLGFRVMENFNWPYLQSNIAAFWRSWHISLSQWCRDYIYSVVVSISRSPALGAICTMCVIGLWHEISFRFLAWGAWHATGIIIWQRSRMVTERYSFELPGPIAASVHVLKVVLTVHFVWFGFVILNADGVWAAFERYRLMLLFWL